MTAKQTTIYNYIRDYIAQNGYAPTIREIADEHDLYHRNVLYYLGALEKAGKIRRVKRISRGIVLR